MTKNARFLFSVHSVEIAAQDVSIGANRATYIQHGYRPIADKPDFRIIILSVIGRSKKQWNAFCISAVCPSSLTKLFGTLVADEH